MIGAMAAAERAVLSERQVVAAGASPVAAAPAAARGATVPVARAVPVAMARPRAIAAVLQATSVAVSAAVHRRAIAVRAGSKAVPVAEIAINAVRADVVPIAISPRGSRFRSRSFPNAIIWALS